MAKKRSRTVSRLKRHTRVRKTMVGTPDRPRLNIFRGLVHIYAQIIDDQIGHTLVSASSIDQELRPRMHGLNKTEQARVVGTKLAERAKAMGISKVVFDRGGFQFIGRVKALAESAREGGLEF